jgi:hypothetical protein
MKTEQGEISKSMGVDTKPAHKLNYRGHWVLVAPEMPEKDLEDMKNALKDKGFEKNCGTCLHWYKTKENQEPCCTCFEFNKWEENPL